MKWLVILVAIVAGEHIANPYLTAQGQWELALGAKYLSMAVVLQLLLAETKQRTLLFRSLVALFCIGTWIDFVGHCVWQIWRFDSSIPIIVIFSVWLIYAARKNYDVVGDHVSGNNVFLLFYKPKSNFEVIKAFMGFPASSVCIYANGQVWSFKRKSGTFTLYLPLMEFITAKHIALDTGIACTPVIEQMLDDVVGTPRFPGTKCVWSIRHVLRKLGGKFAPRWCDYIPGIYAAKLLRGRG